MGDDQRAAVAHEVVEGGLHHALGLGVERRGGLVQDQHRGVAVERAGDRQALALAAGQAGAFLAQHLVITLRQLGDEVGGKGGLGGGAHAGGVGIGVGVGDIGRDGVVEQHHVLAHHRQLLTVIVQAVVGDGGAVEQDVAVVAAVEARDQIDQRGLAATRLADEGHGLTGADVQVDVLQRRGKLRAVGEAQGADIDVATCALDRVLAVVGFDGLVDEREHRLCCSQAAVQAVVDLGQALHRLLQQQHGAHEGHEVTGRQRARLGAHAGKVDDERDRDRDHEQVDAGVQRRGGGALDREPAHLLVGAGEAPGFVALAVEDLDHAVPAQALIQDARQHAHRVLRLQ